MPITLSQNIGVRITSSTVSMAFASPNAGGGLLTLELRTGNSIGCASTVNDSAGNLWQLAGRVVQSAGASGEIWYAQNAVGSTNTIAVTPLDGGGVTMGNAQEWAGCSTASALGAISTHAGGISQSTHSAGPVDVTVSTSVGIILHGFTTSFDIVTAPTGYTPLISTFTNMQAYYRVYTSTGLDTPESVSSGGETSVNLLALFFGGAPPVPQNAMLRRKGMLLMGVS
jgi:hypothetical protein